MLFNYDLYLSPRHHGEQTIRAALGPMHEADNIDTPRQIWINCAQCSLACFHSRAFGGAWGHKGSLSTTGVRGLRKMAKVRPHQCACLPACNMAVMAIAVLLSARPAQRNSFAMTFGQAL